MWEGRSCEASPIPIFRAEAEHFSGKPGMAFTFIPEFLRAAVLEIMNRQAILPSRGNHLPCRRLSI